VPTDESLAYFHLFNVGIQYYIAGRAATRARLIPFAGNLLHHAVEMLLKGELSKTTTLATIKKKYGHFLVKTWDAFKVLHSGEDLSAFDELIADLDRFEKIRYPDEYMKHGAAMSLGFVGADARPLIRRSARPRVPEYTLPVKEVDAFIARLFKICRINPPAYFGGLHPEALESLEYENSESAGWR
jgi:hypothetical protein